MTIYEQIKETLKDYLGETLSYKEIKEKIISNYNTNPSSIILSDYCYNRYNKGIAFNQHLFIYIDRSTYKYVGENYPYTGFIFHKPLGSNHASVVGEWDNGQYHLYPHSVIDKKNIIGNAQIKKLYEEYFEILRFEIDILGFKPTELRHLIGRLGEFYCAIYTKGNLTKVVNQTGFDVEKDGKRISVKTTAQTTGFVSINIATYNQFDDFFVVQYKNDEFNLLFYGPKEEIPKTRIYNTRYEIDISRLKRTKTSYY
ncbi:MAG TPA: hypothetical protein VK121_05270 [Pseudogracilibacillus sp.]|nr:hypothetical protein [Pseudogracilibacillus sp.]